MDKWPGEEHKQHDSLTGDDKAVGEEELQRDLGMADLEAIKRRYEEQYGFVKFRG